MTMNHLNLTVTDVQAARRFLETYFGLQATRNPYTGATVADTGNAGFCVLFDDAGLVLTLMKGRADLSYPPTFHIGFIQASEQAVNDLPTNGCARTASMPIRRAARTRGISTCALQVGSRSRCSVKVLP